MTDIGTIIEGKYEILKEIGRGGMSVVYLSMDKRLNKQWAVKEIRKKGTGSRKDEIVVNSLLAEANLMKRLDHSALPRIVDIIDNGQTIYIVMDYIEGESLDKILEAYGPQSEEAVIGWAKQLCDALGYLHNQKPPIIYRDMKPGNIMLKPEGNIKIIDFGIAREYKEAKLADTTVLGTRGYAPPEQYSGQTDARSDIYALGMTMHHLLTGVDPRKGEVYAPVRQYNPNLSEGIEIIINKCTEPAPENRYQTCAELLYDLEHPELITKGYKKKQKRRLFKFIFAAAAFVIFLLAGFGLLIASKQMINSDYKSKIEAVNSPESYEEAIELKPYETDAYIKLLDYYIENEIFSSEEADYIQNIYNKYSSGFDKTSSGYAEINYKIGILFFSIYSDASSDSDKIQKAKPYFEANYTNTELKEEFENQALSDCYYYICSFYVEYIYKTTGAEAGAEDYEELLDILSSTLGSLDEMEGAEEYEKLAISNSVFYFLKDQCSAMANVGVDSSKVLSIFDEIYEIASDIYVQRENSVALQNEILENYESYRQVIESTFEEAQRKSLMSEG